MKNIGYKVWHADPIYPPLLREISDPPGLLFCLGQKLDPADKYFAIVGTRHPSFYGKQMAEEFASALAGKGFTIVSGLAYGIDAIAHSATLKAGGRTIAVLGGGFDNITPTCNIPLAHRIQEKDCLISEYENSFEPRKGTFPRRNRIIAGMSCATLVIEAPAISGALITARLALEYNRDVFALPANITQESSAGGNRLIRDCKAFPVTCVQDIFDCMELGPAAHQIPKKRTDLNDNENKIHNMLKNGPMSADELAAETRLEISHIATVLSMLELKGLITIKGSHAFVTR